MVSRKKATCLLVLVTYSMCGCDSGQQAQKSQEEQRSELAVDVLIAKMFQLQEEGNLDGAAQAARQAVAVVETLGRSNARYPTVMGMAGLLLLQTQQIREGSSYVRKAVSTAEAHGMGDLTEKLRSALRAAIPLFLERTQQQAQDDVWLADMEEFVALLRVVEGPDSEACTAARDLLETGRKLSDARKERDRIVAESGQSSAEEGAQVADHADTSADDEASVFNINWQVSDPEIMGLLVEVKTRQEAGAYEEAVPLLEMIITRFETVVGADCVEITQGLIWKATMELAAGRVNTGRDSLQAAQDRAERLGHDNELQLCRRIQREVAQVVRETPQLQHVEEELGFWDALEAGDFDKAAAMANDMLATAERDIPKTDSRYSEALGRAGYAIYLSGEKTRGLETVFRGLRNARSHNQEGNILACRQWLQRIQTDSNSSVPAFQQSAENAETQEPPVAALTEMISLCADVCGGIAAEEYEEAAGDGMQLCAQIERACGPDSKSSSEATLLVMSCLALSGQIEAAEDLWIRELQRAMERSEAFTHMHPLEAQTIDEALDLGVRLNRPGASSADHDRDRWKREAQQGGEFLVTRLFSSLCHEWTALWLSGRFQEAYELGGTIITLYTEDVRPYDRSGFAQSNMVRVAGDYGRAFGLPEKEEMLLSLIVEDVEQRLASEAMERAQPTVLSENIPAEASTLVPGIDGMVRDVNVHSRRLVILDYAVLVMSLADAYERLGISNKAEELLLKFVHLCERVDTTELWYFEALCRLGDLCAKAGRHEEGEHYMLQALEMHKRSCEGAQVPIFDLVRMVDFYQEYGPREKARPYLKEADTALKSVPQDDATYMDLVYLLALRYQEDDNVNRAEELLRSALHAETGTSTGVRSQLAVLYAEAGRCSEAMELADKCLSLLREKYPEDSFEFAQNLRWYCRTAWLCGRHTEVLPLLEEVLRILGEGRSKLESDTLRAGYQSSFFQGVCDSTAWGYSATGNPEKAYETIQRGRARGTVELLASRSAVGGRIAPSDELLALEMQISQQRAAQVQIASAPQGEKTRSGHRVEGAVSRLERERIALIEEKTRLDPELGSLLTVSPLSLPEIQRLLEPGTILIEYYYPKTSGYVEESEEELWIFLVTNNGFEQIRVPVERDAFVKKVTAYAEGLADPDSQAKLSRSRGELYEIVLRPIEERIGVYSTLVIVPWEQLYYVPFSAFEVRAGEPLGADKNIVIIPSADVLRYLKGKRASNRSSALVLGNPVTAEVPLREAEIEARAVAGAFESAELLLREDAAETALKAWNCHADVVHFACHGILDERFPQLSRLLLTADEKNDGRLEMHEIYNLDWQGVSLVTLSTCNSGRGELAAGSDVIGLTRGFMFAGAPSVLATLWEVDDESTRLFMEEFYRQYTSGKSKPESLQIAQNKLRSDPKWSHPCFWAPFVLWGDWK